jgi:endonuclease-3 related protein
MSEPERGTPPRRTLGPRNRKAWEAFVTAADRRMLEAVGPREWWPATRDEWYRDEVIVGAVLTQNTAWRNVQRAIGVLRAGGNDDGRGVSLRAIAAMPREALVAAIRPVGYYNLKARRLLAVVDWFGEVCDFDLTRLGTKPTAEFREELLGVHGVGPETADSILLYAFERPVFVIDAYTRRILKWHGLATGDERYEELRGAFETALAARHRGQDGAVVVDVFNEYHALLDTVASRFCDAKSPDCLQCPLGDRRWFASDLAWRRAQKAQRPESTPAR